MDFQFKNSKLCLKQSIEYPQQNPIQHLLPPNMHLHSQQTNILKQQSQQIGFLTQKNNELLDLMNRKEMQRARYEHKYEQLMLLYDEVKNNGISRSTEYQLQELKNSNIMLIDKIKHLERDLVDSEKQLVKRIAYYEEKNEDSRKLLEKLNLNITKRQEKFKSQLHQATQQLKDKNNQYHKLNEQYQNLLQAYRQQGQQAEKFVQETQRDRQIYTTNISTIETKLQHQNTNLKNQILSLNQAIQEIKKLHNLRQNQLKKKIEISMEENTKINEELSTVQQQLGDQINNYNYLQLELKKQEGKNKLLETQNSNLVQQTRLKILQLEEVRSKKIIIQNQNLNIRKEKDHYSAQMLKLSEINIKIQGQNSVYKQDIEKLEEQIKVYVSSIEKNKEKFEELREDNEKKKNSILNYQVSQKKLKEKCERLQAKIRNLEKLLENYKSQKGKLRVQMDSKWKQMVTFYQKQIQKLQTKLHEYSPSANTSVLLKRQETSYFKQSFSNH